ncbi:MAG: dethiobiotin synthase [Acidobacteria bacterium]|nr:dethiobiotin synthase [Acidobacteriota bacterium]
MTRPDQLVFVVGTETEVGKTWASAALLRRWRTEGVNVSARKPVQSFDPDDPAPLDSEVLSAASGELESAVCQFSLPVPMAPPMAAASLGVSAPTLDELVAACSFDDGVDIGLIEGVGGVYSPLADDGHNLDLIERIAPDRVVLVADARLGVINAVRSATIEMGDLTHVVFLNRFDPDDPLHVANLGWLRDRDHLEVTTSIDALASALRFF